MEKLYTTLKIMNFCICSHKIFYFFQPNHICCCVQANKVPLDMESDNVAPLRHFVILSNKTNMNVELRYCLKENIKFTVFFKPTGLYAP